MSLANPFLISALIAVLLTAIATGVVGTLSVANRMVSIGGGLAHAAYGGLGLAFLLGWTPLPVAILFTLFFALALAWLQERVQEPSDTLTGVLWALGMAIGILCIDLSRRYAGDLNAILFGSLLAIPREDLVVLGILDCLLVPAAVLFRRSLLALALDREFAEVSGLPVRALRIGLLVAVSLSVVLLMRVVGLVLMVALLSIPGSLSLRWSRSLGRAMLLSGALTLAFGLAGLWLSWRFDLSSGAAIIAVAGVVYLIATLRSRK
jgi:zinc transport system permease protein